MVKDPLLGVLDQPQVSGGGHQLHPGLNQLAHNLGWQTFSTNLGNLLEENISEVKLETKGGIGRIRENNLLPNHLNEGLQEHLFPLRVGNQLKGVPQEPPHKHHGLIHPPSIHSKPFTLKGLSKCLDEAKAVLTGLKAGDHAGDVLCQFLLDQGFVTHPVAVEEPLPDAHELLLGKPAAPGSKPFLQLLHCPVSEQKMLKHFAKQKKF